MIKNYLKIMLRNMLKHRAYLLINILGLVVAVSCSIFAIAFIADEYAYDQFHSKKDRLYRLNKKNVSINTGESFLTAETSGLMGPTLNAEYPEVENVARVMPWFDETVISYNDKKSKVGNLLFVDSTFFHLFDFKLLRGNPDKALVAPSSIVLTESLAKKLFGEEDPLGKMVTGLHEQEYFVTGIVEDAPVHSHIQYNVLMSWSTTVPGTGPLSYDWMNNWLGQTLITYLLLDEKADPRLLEKKFPDFMKSHFPERAESYFLYLQNFEDVYLYSSDIMYSRDTKSGSYAYVKIFGITALLILLIACINYVNINTAKATKRAGEVGMRKVLGANRKQLFTQFMSESFLLTIISSAIAFFVVDITLPYFNALTGKQMEISLLLHPLVLTGVAGIVLVVGLLSGTYPAFVLSAFQPSEVLKNSGKSKLSGHMPRQVLTTLQFAIAIVLIAATLLVYKQTNFLRNKPLGFDKEHVVVMNIDNAIEDKYHSFQHDLEQHPDIIATSACQATIGSGTFGTTVLAEGREDQISVNIFRTDANFINTLGIEMANGRQFNPLLATDSNALIINEAFVKLMAWEEPLQKQIRFSSDGEQYPVIGVVKDFHFEGLSRNTIQPIVMYIHPRNFTNLTARISGNNIHETLVHMERVWNKYEGRFPFEYYFADTWFDNKYKTEEQLLNTVTVFSVISILLACLGLYGLTSFTIEQRTKEIGIRKVLGATVSGIAVMINRKFVLLVVVAFIVATPVAWHFMNEWLNDFAYKIDMPFGVFGVALASTLVVTLLAVSIQALKAAMMDPVKALKNE
ncbi:putative FtsX-related transmembrane transport protein [Fulvivirga imtechensis AK7]|uniref:Putative FtsX-related transmembrane transport protein n=1 Tax=Fulvivirga imtechensis AK7 TaxID=1237149 RepID=L8JNF5_9BACT|nr:ABC transporter permease [Fulvivirga imtechensis]ELR70355.1 putative FtsX-related transmembrane transport protein [Fulvivirga imtechensis AK7]